MQLSEIYLCSEVAVCKDFIRRVQEILVQNFSSSSAIIYTALFNFNNMVNHAYYKPIFYYTLNCPFQILETMHWNRARTYYN